MTDIPRPNTLLINKSWTLFLDRDGVINERLPGDYVRKPGQFQLMAGVPKALSRLNEVFGRIIVVTNQQGLGKGLMTEADLEEVHRYMLEQIGMAGGRIDKVYHCPHLAKEGCACRKPATGMLESARQDFPGIDPGKSIMVGDTATDILFAKNAGMIAIAVGSDPRAKHEADRFYTDLHGFAKDITAWKQKPEP